MQDILRNSLYEVSGKRKEENEMQQQKTLMLQRTIINN